MQRNRPQEEGQDGRLANPKICWTIVAYFGSHLLLVLLLLAWFIGLSDAAQAEPIDVVTTTTDLAALAQEVGGDRVHVASLAAGYEDPHFVPRDPSFLLKLRRADLLILIGLRLESSWLQDQFQFLAQSGNARIQYGASGSFDVSRYVDIADAPNQVSRAMGIHPLGNPHYWLDPENGRRIAQAIATKLSEMRPDDAGYFQQRFQAFSLRLSESEKVWKEKMRSCRGRRVVTYHRAWPNFLNYFGLISSGEVEPLPGIPPNASHTNDLIQTMKHDNVGVIVVEPYFELKTPNRIARVTGAKVVILPCSVGSEKQITDYFKLMDRDVDLLVRALSSP
jgi:zinc/manganese transport system substrate-binding protein